MDNRSSTLIKSSSTKSCRSDISPSGCSTQSIVEADMISDFTDGSDLIGLHNLNYSDLTIEQGSGDYVNDALISSGSEYLVVIEDIDIADLTDEDFIAFDIV